MTLYPHRIAHIGDLHGYAIHHGQGRAQLPENQVCREKIVECIIECLNEFAKVYFSEGMIN